VAPIASVYRTLAFLVVFVAPLLTSGIVRLRAP
jgi:hypothetical protein